MFFKLFSRAPRTRIHLPLPGRRVRRHPDGTPAGQILSRHRAGLGHNFRERARRDDFTAVRTCSRTNVDDVIGRPNRVFVVFDDDDGIADVPQALQRFQQLVVVPLVQADARLVQNVEDADELGTDLRRQPNALRLAARQRACGPIERQVVEADIDEKAETSPNFFQHLLRDSRSRSLSSSSLKKCNASRMDKRVTSTMLRPPTVTAIVSGRSRPPPHAVHGRLLIYFSISARCQLDVVSRWRRCSCGTTPSNVDSYTRLRPARFVY